MIHSIKKYTVNKIRLLKTKSSEELIDSIQHDYAFFSNVNNF